MSTGTENFGLKTALRTVGLECRICTELQKNKEAGQLEGRKKRNTQTHALTWQLLPRLCIPTPSFSRVTPESVNIIKFV